MKKIVLLISACLFFSSCQNSDPPLQNKVETTIEQNKSGIVELKKLRAKPGIIELENKLKLDSLFKKYDKAMSQIRLERFVYADEKIDNEFIAVNRKSATTVNKLSKIYKNAGMKDAEKRLKNKLDLIIARGKLCKKYPEYCNLPSFEQSLLLISNSELVV
ncbi:MAG: hypothetical protein ACK4YV_14365, partial [Emticicia sp.]